MSGPSEEPEEPDLTALLDLVLQLVMFFLAVARIDNEQRDQSVILPQAAIARSLTKDYNRIVIVNVYPAPPLSEEEKQRRGGRVSEVKYSVFEGYGVREYDAVIQVKDNLTEKFKTDQKAVPKSDWDAGKGRSLVVLRAHKDCRFEQVFAVMNAAREVGYSDIQLRAYVAGASPR